MAIARVTQSMMTQRSARARLQTQPRPSWPSIQEQLSTGRVLNRPSDSPSDTTAAMRMRSSIADQKQYARNAEDGLGWLGQTDDHADRRSTPRCGGPATWRSRASTARSARPPARRWPSRWTRSARALIASANTTYLGRPVFGGITAGSQAFDPTTGDLRRHSPAR